MIFSRIIGGFKSPFRLPCDGAVTGPSAFGGHRKATDVPVNAFTNTTMMKDHCGNDIDAKPLLYQLDTCGNEVCSEPGCNDCPGGTDLVINTPPGPPLSGNTWNHVGTKQLVPCNKTGTKLVQAYKVHHGRYGFVSTCTPPTPPSNTKYLTIDCSFSLKTYGNAPGEEMNYNETTGTCTMTVNSTTGERTLSNCSVTVQDVDVTTTPPTVTPSALPPSMAKISEMEIGCIPTWFQAVLDDIAAGNGANYTTATRTISETTHEIHFLPAVVTDSFSFDGVLTLSEAYTTDDVLAQSATQAAQWALDDDKTYPFRTDDHTTVAPLVVLSEQTSPVSPSLNFTCEVDDLTLPIIDFNSIAPFDMDWTPTYTPRAWFDTNFYIWGFAPGTDVTNAASTGLVALYDGSIIGSPLAAGYGWPTGAGPQGVFNNLHENWFRRNCTLGPGWSQASESRGNYTAGYLPANCQLWTDDFAATTLWPCAFIHADEGGVYIQKWAETQIRRPSINFGRPYGPDKFLLDETAVFFVSDFTAGVVTLKDNVAFSTPPSLPFTLSDIVGSAAVGGFWNIGSIGTDTVTLGSKVFDVPTDWDTPSKDGTACFGRLRFPTAPGMDFLNQTPEVGGRVAITVTNGSPVTLTTATLQKYLSITTDEAIDIYDADMLLLASGVNATRVDDSNFTVTSSYSDIVTAKWIVAAGSAYKFVDAFRKGDYVYRTWLIDTSDSSILSQSQTQSCLAFGPCNPSVVMVTPNGEAPESGESHAFPTSINAGELWLGQVKMWMIDPFWQPPHVPVAYPDFVPGTDLIIFHQDDGSCAGNSTEVGGGGENIFTIFYAMPPFVEARCTLPVVDGDTAAAPAGIDITVAPSPPAQASIGDSEGRLVDAIILPATPGGILARQLACVAALGQFSDEYKANGSTTPC